MASFVEISGDAPLDGQRFVEVPPMARLDLSGPLPSSGAYSAGLKAGDVLNRVLPNNPTARDVIQSAASAVPRVGATLMGLPVSAINAYAEHVPSKTAGPRSIFFTPLQGAIRSLAGEANAATGMGTPESFPGGVGDMLASANDLGMVHKPQTVPGEYAGTVSEFALPGGLLGRGRGLLAAMLGGGASETGGQITKGTPAEPWARLAGGLFGTGAAGFLPTGNASRMLNLRLSGLGESDFALARDRMAEGQRIGVPLSAAEAVESRPLAALAADTAVTPTGGPQIGRMMDTRAQTIPSAIRENVAPEISSTTPEMRAAGARNAMSDLGERSRAAGYTAADAQTLDRGVMQPLIERVVAAWEKAPVEAKAALANLHKNLVNSEGNIGKVSEAWAVAKAKIAPPSDRGALSPAQKAEHDALVRNMSDVVDDIRTTLQSNPDFRRGLKLYTSEAKSGQIMQQADDVLETAAKPTQAGPTRMAGVNWRNQILGGPGSQAEQTAKETIMEAARRAGRDPDEAWTGAQKIFDVLERTGRIPGSGSQTAGRLGAAQEAGNTGVIGTVTGASVAQPLNFLDRVLANTLQRNVYRTLGNLFTNTKPEAVDIMVRMARMNDQSAAMMLPSLLNAAQEAK